MRPTHRLLLALLLLGAPRSSAEIVRIALDASASSPNLTADYKNGSAVDAPQTFATRAT